jgi:hypothetical protein
MTLKSEHAREAFKVYLGAAPGLPAPTRNDTTLDTLAEAPGEAVKWKLALVDEDVVRLRTVVGDPPEYEVAAVVNLILAVEGVPGAARDQVFANAVEALAAALFPAGEPLRIDGAFDYLEVDDRLGGDHIMPDAQGRLPIQTFEVLVQLVLTAQTPLG